MNALNFQIVAELASALGEFDRDESIRCLVITGAGEKAFAAGADIKEMADKSPVDMLLSGFEAWEKLRRLHKPLIAAVGGYALGGGCELAMHCDIIVASENARFGQPEINLGIIPGAGGTQRLARTLGKFLTMEMVLLGKQFTAQEMPIPLQRLHPQSGGQRLDVSISTEIPLPLQQCTSSVMQNWRDVSISTEIPLPLQRHCRCRCGHLRVQFQSQPRSLSPYNTIRVA